MPQLQRGCAMGQKAAVRPQHRCVCKKPPPCKVDWNRTNLNPISATMYLLALNKVNDEYFTIFTAIVVFQSAWHA